MTTLEHFVSPALVRALGWTLLHSLWQGALVAGALAGALLLLRRQRAEVRYVASVAALGLVVVLAGTTFGLYFRAGDGKILWRSPGAVQAEQPAKPRKPTEISAATVAVGVTGKTQLAPSGASVKPAAVATETAPQTESHSVTQSLIHSLKAYFDQYLPLLVVAWLLGLLAMSLRLLGGLLYVQRLRNYRVRPLPAAWQERLAALVARSGVRRPVALLESALVHVPLVVGHMRPVILLPLGTVAGLSPAYLEAILAHELAHVLRRDYLVNLLQTVAEALFFYHPAVWFVAGCVRTERENCCDDTATALVGGDPLRLARALTALAEWSHSAVVPAAPRLALAAMGRRGALLSRVRRLVQRRPAAPTLAEGLLAGALVLGGLGLLGGSVVLASPLARPATLVGKSAAFAWQGKAVQMPVKPVAGLEDTTKRAKTSSTTTTTIITATPEIPVVPGEIRREITRTLEDAEQITADAARFSQDDPRHPRRAREQRRMVINGREMGPPVFASGPGTVVITKDKKGRLTDLVVNGQHVETAADRGGKRKNKEKSGSDDSDRRTEIIRVLPAQGFGPQGFAFHYDAEALGRGQRELHRYQFKMQDLQQQTERDSERGHNFQFSYPDLSPQLSERLALRLKDLPGGTRSGAYRPRGLGPDPTGATEAQRRALRAAERGLREASAVKSISADQRRRLTKALADVQSQLKQLDSGASSARQLRLNGATENRDLSEEAQNRQEEMLDRQEVMRNREEELRDRQEEFRNRAEEMQDHAEEFREKARERADHRRDQNEALVAELLKDGLIQDKDNFQFKLTALSLVVNGKEQPQKVLQKYLKLYESSTGRPMSATGTMMMTHNGNTTSDHQEAPRPPRLPRLPRAPRGPMAPSAAMPPMPPMPPLPTPPAPPRPPQADTETLRNELRKDGLLGASEQSFQFQLNGSGLTVNGKKQPDELAAKYRKLTGHADGRTFNMSISTQE